MCYVASARLADKISAASGYYGGQIMPYLDERPEAALAKQRTLDHFAAHLG